MDIVVIGSLSTDFIVESYRTPEKGETIVGDSFKTACGGKGANQAVAAARLGSDVSFIGAISDDGFGETLKANLRENNISCEHLETIENESSGTAHITIYEQDNSIIFVPGTNGLVSPDMIKEKEMHIKEAEYVLIQNEIPIETTKYIIDFCFENDIKLIYNPAPFLPIETEYIDKCDLITPNENECEALFGANYRDMIKRYPNKLLVTLGSEGCVYNNGTEDVSVPAYQTDPIDTTGAGDVFNGALTAFLAQGRTLEAAIGYANLAAAISIRKIGAQGGTPTLEEWKREYDNI